jgi:thiol-disulfide isomerase/thioredoxin
MRSGIQLRVFAFVALAITLSPARGFCAVQESESDPIRWTISTDVRDKPLKKGDRFAVILTAHIGEGWHLYSLDQTAGGPIPTRIALPDGQGFKLADEIDAPAPKVEFDPVFNLETQFYEGSAEFIVPVLFERETPQGPPAVKVSARYQTCNSVKCLPVKVVTLSVDLKLMSGSTTTAVAKAVPAASQPPASQATGAKGAGMQVPDFAFIDFEGKTRKFSEYRGKHTLLDFWATWCGPCLADMPRLRKLHDKYKSRGFEILGMDAETLGQDGAENDKETLAAAKKVATAKGAIWAHAISESAVPVAEKIFNIDFLPTKILVDPQGKVVRWVTDKDDLDAILDSILLK